MVDRRDEEDIKRKMGTFEKTEERNVAEELKKERKKKY